MSSAPLFQSYNYVNLIDFSIFRRSTSHIFEIYQIFNLLQQHIDRGSEMCLPLPYYTILKNLLDTVLFFSRKYLKSLCDNSNICIFSISLCLKQISACSLLVSKVLYFVSGMVSSARSHQITFWIFAASSHKSNPRSIIYIYIYPISSQFVIMLIYLNMSSSLRACVYCDIAYI